VARLFHDTSIPPAVVYSPSVETAISKTLFDAGPSGKKYLSVELSEISTAPKLLSAIIISPLFSLIAAYAIDGFFSPVFSKIYLSIVL
jgi:hypothetical protein